MKWRKKNATSWATPDGFTVAKFHIDGTDILGVTPPDARKPAFFGDRAEVLEWIERHREGIISGTD